MRKFSSKSSVNIRELLSKRTWYLRPCFDFFSSTSSRCIHSTAQAQNEQAANDKGDGDQFIGRVWCTCKGVSNDGTASHPPLICCCLPPTETESLPHDVCSSTTPLARGGAGGDHVGGWGWIVGDNDGSIVDRFREVWEGGGLNDDGGRWCTRRRWKGLSG
jgi:hypothetical protein